MEGGQAGISIFVRNDWKSANPLENMFKKYTEAAASYLSLNTRNN